jgi:hypothetical protein
MTTTATTTENSTTETTAVNWPYHVNPETGRANKCYKVDNCRFGIPADQHYATAAEALAHAPAKDAAKVKGTRKADREEVVVEDTAATETTAEAEAPAAETAAPVKKRGRGRPRKVQPEAPTGAIEGVKEGTEAPAPKRRGRPKKAESAVAPEATAAEVIEAADEAASTEVLAEEAQPAAEIKVIKGGLLQGKSLEEARKHDAKINKLYVEREEQQALLTGNLRTLAHRMGLNLKKRIDPDKVLARAEASESPERIQKYLDWAKQNLAAVNQAQAQIEKLDNDYAGWARYFIVPGGHVHTSTQCRTCNHSWEHPTQFEWLTDFSGAKLEDVVEQHGAVLCTVCFPEAPLDWTNYFDRLAEEKKKSQCSGSATWDYDLDTARLGQPSGNYGICEHCGEKISITSTGKLRAHRSPEVIAAAEAVAKEAAKIKQAS